ncbi:MAG: DUF1800 domain-containing protein, partial [Anaerolineae bacterium]|nr:DUF1800 domain-containing protein [Anaerolineae bacterium]
DSSDPPNPEVRALRRLSFGLKPGDLDYFMGLGADFDTRLTNYVNAQLDSYTPPTPGKLTPNDPDLAAALNAQDVVFETLTDSLETLWQGYNVLASRRYYPLLETQRFAFMRAVYSQWQLVEQLADFWHTHFSINGEDFDVAPVFVHYDRDAIRQHMLGNFREMLEAVTKSTAMMYYLDNVSNTKWGPNENYARELQELHTLGAVHSYGFDVPPNVTPLAGSTVSLPAGLKNGYTEDDVLNVTRALTGWSINNGQHNGQAPRPNNGTFVYDAFWHDNDPKQVLGITLSSSGEQEVHEILDLLAQHPNTARYVCTKLCRYFVSDNPPSSLVESAALVFHNQWDQPNQLREVVKTILLSDEFKSASTWGQKVKRPFVTVAGALRSCNLNFNFTNTSDEDSLHYQNSWDFQWTMELTGHMPFTWETPDGFADKKEAWLGGTTLVMSWRCINWLFRSAGEYGYRVDAVAATKAALDVNERTAANIVDYWLERILGYASGTTPAFASDKRMQLIAFMQQDAASPDTVLDLDLDTVSNS